MLSALSVVSAPGAVLVLLVGCLVRIIYAFYFSPYRHIPGPAICKITGLWTGYQDVLLRRNEAIHQWHRKYGGVVLIAPGEVSFSTPGPTKEIYGTTGKHPKSSYFSNFIMYGERPIFATLGVRDHRQLLKRTFGFYQKCNIYKAENIQPIEASAQTFLNELGGATTGWTTVDVLLLCNFYSFDNITRLVYGARHSARTLSTDCEERRILEGWKECELWNNFLYNLPFTRWPLMTSVSLATGNRGFLKGEDRLSDWNMEKLRSIIEDPENVDLDSLLGRLYMRKSEKGEPISIKWIAAEVLDNMHAAQTTVALALTYALWNLACEPKWQIKLRDELSALPRSENGMPRFADIDAAPMLDACIRESNRLNPLSSGHAERVVPATKAYQDVVIPAGTCVSVSAIAIHRSETAFSDPDLYNPDRWLLATPEALTAMEACYMPFGYGARLCLGRAFAVAEIKILMAYMLLQFEFRGDLNSSTDKESMKQLGTQNALPRGLRCDIAVRALGQ